MKSVFIILTFCLIINQAFAQKKNQIADRNIKYMTQHTVDNRRDNKSEKTIFSRYDKDGNVIEQIEYNEDSSIAKWEKYSFYKNGEENLLLELDPNGKQKKKVIGTFDSFGNKIEEMTFNAEDSLIEKTVYSFNNFNEKVAETTYDKNGKIKTKAVFEYESKGMLKSKTVYNAENAVIYLRTYKYGY